jgi:hypothetical protein
MSLARQSFKAHVIQLLYLVLVAFCYYLLAASRTGEAYTVWQNLHPAFIPLLFAAAFVLLTILFTSNKTAHKLLLIIVYSILIHSFFSIVFPAGDLSGQQMVLGRTRRVFDNTILHGWTGLPTQTVQVVIYEMFQGVNLQAALSTIFARILGLDIFYVHLFFVPVLWSIFVPVAAFLTTKALSGSENASILSSLVVSAFPYTIYFGAISVPNSLGFIFFFYSFYFTLEYLASKDSKTAYFAVVFTFFSFLSHFVTGIMSLSLLLLATVFKAYRMEKKPSAITTRISLIVAFFACASLLPASFTYLRLLDPSTNVSFSLDKVYESSIGELVGLFLFGSAYAFDVRSIFLLTIGPATALLWMLYLLYQTRKSPIDKFSERIQFVFGAYMIVLIDYRILNMFMSGLPINEERLWVLRDLMASPFTALAIWSIVTAIKTRIPLTKTITSKKLPSRKNILRFISAILALNIMIPALLGGWLICSLGVAYPRSGFLQTTWYELEAAEYIKAHSDGPYVVIGDIWTVYAGEMIVGISNPTEYYFKELDAQRQRLFTQMLDTPSPKIMVEAMNQTGIDTKTAYFIVTEPRLVTEVFNRVVSEAKEALTVFHVAGDGKLYVFSYKKEQT